MTYRVSESLKPGTKYDIIMLSKNKFDRISAPSEPVTASTEPESVHQIRQTQEFRDKIRFTFYPPKRGKAEEFEVKLFQPNDLNPEEPILVDVQNIEFKEDATTYLVNFDKPNLKPGAQYEVQVVSKSLGKESVAVRQKVSTGMLENNHEKNSLNSAFETKIRFLKVNVWNSIHTGKKRTISQCKFIFTTYSTVMAS